jgi:hypothetical protein
VLVILVTIASSAGGFVAGHFDRTRPVLIAGIVGALAATSFLVIYVAHGALVWFLGVLTAVILLAAIGAGFAATHWRQATAVTEPDVNEKR